MKGQSRQSQIKIFEELFHSYYERLVRYAFTIIKDETNAADIAQSVFVKVWDKREDLNISDAFENYLYRATYNLCLNEIRNTKSKSRHKEQTAKHPRSTDNANHKVTERELADRIDKIMKELPPQCKLIFQKSRMEGKKYAEIAAELDISVKTVETQIGRALTRFRKGLKDYLIILIIIIMLFNNI
ncbi:RNA polymerase sigma-70 factor [Arachidicoccus sp.]|uniref:RNA polymerase sigma-70 factor n=1 Tax=Arachidicoccus sp. TaxID=1872624 RepID=UPI003D1ACE18